MDAPGYDTLLDIALLETAFEKVKDNKGISGVDEVTTDDFEAQCPLALQILLSDLQSGAFMSGEFRQVTMKKAGKSPRQLVIPTVRDRIVHTAIAMILQPSFENEFEKCSYGYRPKRSYKMAVGKVVEYRDSGYHWVVDADIAAFFDSIPHYRLMKTLSHYIQCERLTSLIRNCLFTPQMDQGNIVFGLAKGQGIPQGSPLSPLLANLYLDVFDEEIIRSGHRLVRYADDFVILTQSKPQASDALQLTDKLLRHLDLALNESKTQIVCFDDGFSFLGHTFINNIVLDEKSQIPFEPKGEDTAIHEDHIEQVAYLSEIAMPSSPIVSELGIRIADCEDDSEFGKPDSKTQVRLNPRMKTLYISNQGAIVSKRGLRAQVKLGSQLLTSVPFGTLDSVVLLGRVHLTTDTLAHCMQHNITVVLASRSGLFKGVADSYKAYNETLLRAQVAHTASLPRRLKIARKLLQAKINNSLVLLKRRVRKHPNQTALQPELDDFAEQVKRSLNRIKKENSQQALLGVEGSVARGYFSLFKKLIPTHWHFDSRNRQPPKDPVNVMLSLGYTILFNQLHTFCKLQKVNPTFGYIHDGADEQPSLVLDLMEEFRAPIVDACVLSLISAGKMLPEFFNTTEDGCEIKPEGYKVFFKALEAKLNSHITHNATENVTDYRRVMEHQVRMMKTLIIEDNDDYQGFTIR